MRAVRAVRVSKPSTYAEELCKAQEVRPAHVQRCTALSAAAHAQTVTCPAAIARRSSCAVCNRRRTSSRSRRSWESTARTTSCSTGHAGPRAIHPFLWRAQGLPAHASVHGQVRWVGYDEGEDTWEFPDTLASASKLIAAFERRCAREERGECALHSAVHGVGGGPPGASDWEEGEGPRGRTSREPAPLARQPWPHLRRSRPRRQGAHSRKRQHQA